MQNETEQTSSTNASAAHPLAGTVIAEHPTTESHNKLQAQIDKEREEAFSRMPPEIRERYELVHKAAGLLNEAKIPFYLGAIPLLENQAIDYSRFNYLHEPYDNSKEASETWRRNTWNIGSHFIRQFTLMFPEMQVIYAIPKAKAYIGYWESGIYRTIEKKEAAENNQKPTENNENTSEKAV